MKRLFGIFLIIIIALFGFSACANGNTNANDNDSENNTPTETEQQEITKMYITINGNKLEVTLAENSSVDALIEILKHGDIIFTANENDDFEMYGDIGHDLPTNDTYVSAQAGDVILYAGSYLCLFFGSNAYSYTEIGKINGYTASQLRTLLGADKGSAQVTLSLN